MADDDTPKVHTTPEEGHPAGTGERSDRDIGGPTSADSGDDEPQGEAHGTKQSPFDAHE